MTEDLLKEKQERFLALVYSVFELNAQGKELFLMLKENLVDKIAVADPDKDASHAFYREGQNSVIRAMQQNIEAYKLIMKENAKKSTEAR